MRLVADTSAVLAAIVTSEPRHQDCRNLLQGATHVFLTAHVSTEVFYLLNSGGYLRAATDFLSDIANGFYSLIDLGPSDYDMAQQLIKRYTGQISRKRPKQDLDLADAMNVIAAAHEETTIIATLDQDYRILKPLVGPSFFTLVPDDL